MNTPRTASFLLAAASLGSLVTAAVTCFLPAVLGSAAVLALSALSWRFLARREARQVRDRIAVLGDSLGRVERMAGGGVTRRAYVRGIGLAGKEEAAA